MIAKVKVAPYERWCEAMKSIFRNEGWDPARIVGLPAEIETSSMRKATSPQCGGRVWRMSQRSETQHAEIVTGEPYVGQRSWPCEHFLEMD